MFTIHLTVYLFLITSVDSELIVNDLLLGLINSYINYNNIAVRIQIIIVCYC